MPETAIRPPKPLNRRTASPEQITAARKVRRRWLADVADWAIGSLTQPDAWRSFLWTAAMHPNRPRVTNLALIAVQAPGEVTRTYRQWRAEGRQVRRGEPGLLIYTSVIKEEDDNDPELRGFSTGTLFAYGQTDPADGTPADAQQAPPGPPSPRTADELHAAATVALHTLEMRYNRAQGIPAALTAAAAARGLSPDDAASAAYLAALTLGVPDPGTAPPPQAQTGEPDEVRDAAQRVIDHGRALAEQFAALALPPF
ncbi:ArdC family protein [Streptomyces sp. 549]|uniref:ArdC family protein n=1 Tax=Streptomyces sp. 549 TaxID=3049076 RepID=UPI0024C218C0|nr:ArdC family protein [Streptomyces sp. 549]MDK1476823.1 ArdC family protein [Streptomyces sp. 549]